MESSDLGMGGDEESSPETLFSLVVDQAEIEIHAPQTPGAYRLFIYVTDQGRRTATANIPFFVEK